MLINGKELSEETIAKACEAYGISFEKKYVFKAGDVARPKKFRGEIRIIMRQRNGELVSFCKQGVLQSVGQKEFEGCGYEFIGRLKDLLKT